MARETKQDRIVRGMLDQVSEHLHELRAIEQNPMSKESDVERWAQSFLKNCLGYMSSSGYTIRAQEQKGKHRPDLIVFHNERPLILIEVKKLGFNLSKSDFRSGKVQLAEYLNALGTVKWGILTNGFEWRLFDFSDLRAGGVQIASFELKDGDAQIDVAKRAVEELCYEMLDVHESTYQEGAWVGLSKEATVYSPETLAKAILNYDTIRYIAKTIRGEHEYRANLEELCDSVHILLEEGLNDAHIGWNEAKSIELQKYVKSQKKNGRRARKAKRVQIEVTVAQEPQKTDDSVSLVSASDKDAKPNVA